jgi:hypothetical protein
VLETRRDLVVVARTDATDDVGRPPKLRDGAVGVAGCLELLERNISRHDDKDAT